MNLQSSPRQGLHLLDLAAMVVGYSLASVLVRAFWPAVDEPSFPVLCVLGIVFLWLGMAMSGPIVMLGHRRPSRDPEDSDAPEPRTWAELAWLIIGFYWIGLTILVVPVRLHQTRVLDSAVLGVFPVLAAVGLRVFRPSSISSPTGRRYWTHDAAIGLLVTWPFAWVALIILGKSLP
ncbi:hypothetical protein V5E97_17705 [Singulisphaera sp. Ch08]|uniref:Uncharacterized protein n=1 Tax=Singulisphaera sp. Ch08 TaxID=3120278 RepID=A0AAU7CR88_9BACT